MRNFITFSKTFETDPPFTPDLHCGFKEGLIAGARDNRLHFTALDGGAHLDGVLAHGDRKDSPVSAAWSTSTVLPSRSTASAGTMDPI